MTGCTDLAVLGYAEATKRMQVLSLHPGITMEMVQDRTVLIPHAPGRSHNEQLDPDGRRGQG